MVHSFARSPHVGSAWVWLHSTICLPPPFPLFGPHEPPGPWNPFLFLEQKKPQMGKFFFKLKLYPLALWLIFFFPSLVGLWPGQNLGPKPGGTSTPPPFRRANSPLVFLLPFAPLQGRVPLFFHQSPVHFPPPFLPTHTRTLSFSFLPHVFTFCCVLLS